MDELLNWSLKIQIQIGIILEELLSLFHLCLKVHIAQYYNTENTLRGHTAASVSFHLLYEGH